MVTFESFVFCIFEGKKLQIQHIVQILGLYKKTEYYHN